MYYGTLNVRVGVEHALYVTNIPTSSGSAGMWMSGMAKT